MRMSVVSGAVFSILAFGAASARAQDLRLTGHVLSDSAKPLQYTRVDLEGTGIGAVTDSDGKYAFIYSGARLHGQRGKLTASRLGYRTTSVDVVLSGTLETHDFTLPSTPITCCFDPITYPPPFPFSTADFVRGRSDVVHAAGLRDLSSEHRSGQRELRVWTAAAGSLALLRMVERNGVAIGELIRYRTWPDRRMRDSQWRFVSRDYTKNCEHIRTRELIFTCRASIPHDADWKQPWDELEAAGIWDLPSNETWETPIIVDESVGNPITVELWDGEAYRAWTYVSPTELMFGNGIQGYEREYAIWRVTRGIELLSGQ
jgi:hypothetical protein